MNDAPLLTLREVKKNFGSVSVLKGIDLEVYPGEVVGILGDNGAGKSTLIKIISGVHSPSYGDMYIMGKKITSFSPENARNMGIETIYQDLALAGNLNVTDNIFLGRELKRRFLGVLRHLDRRRMYEEGGKALSRLGIRIDSLMSKVENLSGGQQQAVAIARALYWKARLVIMDEPTAALAVAEHDEVLRLVRDLANLGVAVILITHTLTDALRVTDRIVVLTRGLKPLEAPTRDLNSEDIVKAMLVGREDVV